ncbi:VOC family protein [Sphingomonas morindae]|uniref:VOC family protein n=1 Tax=Sphingomonas morindae TaxID=1541170 RepID=A0ABY4X8U4_9SPHN|nr:VOC family protein [Sphingomonas morindae]USI73357.1 VOC family protein [Sphingomonas morindae]
MRPAIIPCLRYADAPSAILFLCDAFGFLPAAIHGDEEDQQIIYHAQLVLGEAMVMLASAEADDEAQALYGWRSPEEAGGVTQTLYVVVEDVDGHCARARAAGARILSEPHDNEGYPGRGYDAVDPEGHVWSFGSYDPFAPPVADA